MLKLDPLVEHRKITAELAVSTNPNGTPQGSGPETGRASASPQTKTGSALTTEAPALVQRSAGGDGPEGLPTTGGQMDVIAVKDDVEVIGREARADNPLTMDSDKVIPFAERTARELAGGWVALGLAVQRVDNDQLYKAEGYKDLKEFIEARLSCLRPITVQHYVLGVSYLREEAPSLLKAASGGVGTHTSAPSNDAVIRLKGLKKKVSSGKLDQASYEDLRDRTLNGAISGSQLRKKIKEMRSDGKQQQDDAQPPRADLTVEVAGDGGEVEAAEVPDANMDGEGPAVPEAVADGPDQSQEETESGPPEPTSAADSDQHSLPMPDGAIEEALKRDEVDAGAHTESRLLLLRALECIKAAVDRGEPRAIASHGRNIQRAFPLAAGAVATLRGDTGREHVVSDYETATAEATGHPREDLGEALDALVLQLKQSVPDAPPQ